MITRLAIGLAACWLAACAGAPPARPVDSRLFTIREASVRELAASELECPAERIRLEQILVVEECARWELSEVPEEHTVGLLHEPDECVETRDIEYPPGRAYRVHRPTRLMTQSRPTPSLGLSDYSLLR